MTGFTFGNLEIYLEFILALRNYDDFKNSFFCFELKYFKNIKYILKLKRQIFS